MARFNWRSGTDDPLDRWIRGATVVLLAGLVIAVIVWLVTKPVFA